MIKQRIALIFVTFCIKLFIDVPMMLLGILLFPLAYRFHDSKYEDGRLVAHFPLIFWLWDNKDHGIDGEGFWERRTIGQPYWWRCFQWSCLRNPTFNFSKYLMGKKSNGRIDYVGSPPLDDDGKSQIGDKKGEGWSWIRQDWAWEFYYIKAYTLFGKRYCFRFRAGWKLYGKEYGERCQFVFAGTPFKTYTGK